MTSRSGSPARSLLLVVASNRRRGGEVFGEQLGGGLRKLGWEVDLVALSRADDAATIDAEALLESAPRGRLDPRLAWRLRRRIAERSPAVVFANGGSTLRYAAAAMFGLRRRPLLAYSSIGEPRYWTRSPRHAQWLSFLHKRADAVLAVSEVTRRQLISQFGLSPGDVHTTHTGVADSFFEIEPTPVHGGPLRALFLGSLSAEKDPGSAVRAVAAVPDGGVDIRFVGAGPLQEETKSLARSLGIDESVEVVGSVADVRPHLQWADVLLLTSRTEGFPGVVLEAAAAGVPTVAFAVGGTAEAIVDDKTGFLVSAGDEPGLVSALLRLRDNTELRSAMGAAARQHVQQEFTLPRSVQRYHEVLTAALGAHAKRVAT